MRGDDGAMKHIIVVTSPYHVKRARMILKKNLRNCGVTVLGTPYVPSPKKWWKDQIAATNVVNEIAKIMFYVAGGRFLQSDNVK